MTSPSQAITALRNFADRYSRDGEIVASRLNDWCLPASCSGDGRRSRGGHADPTFSAATSCADSPHHDRRVWVASLAELRSLAVSFGCVRSQSVPQMARAFAAVVEHSRVPSKLLRRVWRICDDLVAIMARCTPLAVLDKPAVPVVEVCVVCERVGLPLAGGLCDADRKARRRAEQSGRYLGEAAWREQRRAEIARGETLPDSPLNPKAAQP